MATVNCVDFMIVIVTTGNDNSGRVVCGKDYLLTTKLDLNVQVRSQNVKRYNLFLCVFVCVCLCLCVFTSKFNTIVSTVQLIQDGSAIILEHTVIGISVLV